MHRIVTRTPWLILALGWFLAATPAAAAERAELRGIGTYEIPSWFKVSFLDLPEDVREAARGGKRLLVYFGQKGCPYCAELFNHNFSQAEIVDYTRKHFDAIAFDMWGSREVTFFTGETLPEKQLAAKLKVWFTPTILFFNEQGEQVLRINGYYPPHQFLTALKYVAEKQEQRMSFREYLAKNAPPASSGRLHTQAFFAKPPHQLDRVSQNKPIAVFFEQRDCPGCDRLHTKIMTEPATRELLKKYHVIQLDRWSDMPVVTPAGAETTARAWGDALNISYAPTAVLFDGGKEIIRIEAMLRAFHVQSVLDYVASGAYRQQPSLQRYIQSRADALRERGIAVDLWK